MSRILVTGGAGFIGSNFVRHHRAHHPTDELVVLDALTYAGNRASLADLEQAGAIRFVHGDIRDRELVHTIMKGTDVVVHLAAESHVDRSISDPSPFISTNVQGTCVLLDAASHSHVKRFLHVSTDEVYGSIGSGSAIESDPLRPSSPYAASKAAADLLVLAHHATYATPILVTRASNNFGPYQFPEKLIPLFVTNALDGLTLPLYGDGQCIRDWLFVEDHCAGLEAVLKHGAPGGIYNLGSGNQHTNLAITDEILRLLALERTRIRYVADRPGHDRRYSIDSTRATALGWKPRHQFEKALSDTVRWYKENEAWWRPLKKGATSPTDPA